MTRYECQRGNSFSADLLCQFWQLTGGQLAATIVAALVLYVHCIGIKSGEFTFSTRSLHLVPKTDVRILCICDNGRKFLEKPALHLQQVLLGMHYLNRYPGFCPSNNVLPLLLSHLGSCIFTRHGHVAGVTLWGSQWWQEPASSRALALPVHWSDRRFVQQ